MNSNTIQRRLECFLATRVQHFVFNTGRIGIPSNQHQLARRPSVGHCKFQIDETVTAIIIGQGRAKVIVGLAAFSLAVNDNRLLVLNLVHVVAQFFALTQLEQVERIGYFVIYNNACRLRDVNKRHKQKKGE